ncbi:MAG: hypothetical protein KGI06_06245 [Candidatus Micrarchaeota archaeon]|nr:hypothetical protein [Candidatus Micrarchaeota archaeon]
MPSSLTNPLTDAEVDAANQNPKNIWMHVKCKICGDVEPCYNRTQVAWSKTCFPCLMGWKRANPFTGFDGIEKGGEQ